MTRTDRLALEAQLAAQRRMREMPALAGEVVTEFHARICREVGHATHTVDGIDQGVCPRCGDVTERPAE
ncbi:hypothetical protein [Kribbella italica]|uniref:Uncharacterized protein n=1 Tax=Kribbella italica TaxID=1540520 RepID=A0A7W9J0J6_9ACTN|nr:hypothetical protein [Kribbella italica]MBB5833426.1 hypothetical protein [Kribbella italica]